MLAGVEGLNSLLQVGLAGGDSRFEVGDPLLAGVELGCTTLDLDVGRVSLHLRAPGLVAQLAGALVELATLICQIGLEAAKPRLAIGERRRAGRRPQLVPLVLFLPAPAHPALDTSKR